MNPFEMVVLIVLIVVAGRVLSGRRWSKVRRWEADAMEAENDRLKAEVDRLADRVAVLEKLATDPSRRLGDEIDALRRR